ncbi:MAG: pseudoazurin [Pseudomonadota bacterium]
MIRTTLLAVMMLAGGLSAATAAEHEIQMLNKSEATGDRMVYEPAFIEVAVGETVTWRAADKGHNVEFIKDGVPDGVEGFKSKINKEVSYTFETPGVYFYKCTPHFGMGMVGMIVVGGDTSNLEAASSARFVGRSKARASDLAEQAAAL